MGVSDLSNYQSPCDIICQQERGIHSPYPDLCVTHCTTPIMMETKSVGFGITLA